MKLFSIMICAILLITTCAFAQNPDDVVIPWNEFIKLWEASQGQEEVVEKPPLDYLLSRANYQAKIGKDVVKIDAEIELTVLKSGWNMINLMQKDTPISEAKIDGRPVTLVVQGGYYKLITQTTGRHILTLTIEVPVQRHQGPDFFQFYCPSTSITVLSVESPEKTAEFKINGSEAISRKEIGDKVLIEKALPTATQIRVEWTKAVTGLSVDEEKDPLVYSEVYSLISIGEGVMSCQSTVNYQILQAGVDQFRFAIPEDSELIEVRGRAVRDWEKKSVEKQKVVDVYLNYKVKDNFDLTIRYEKNMGGTSAVSNLPVLQILDVERSKGFIGVEARTNVEISVESTDLAKLDVKELPQRLVNTTSNPILLAFKYIRTPFELVLSVQKHEDLAVLTATVDDAEIISLATEEGRTITHCTYWVRNNRRQFMKLNLPEGANVWSTFVNNEPVKPAKNEDDQLLLPLRKSEQVGENVSTFSVELIYLVEGEAWRKRGKFHAEIPKIDIPISQIRWSMYTPKDYKFADFKGTINEVKSFSTWKPETVSGYSSTSADYQQREPERAIPQTQALSNVPMTWANRQIVVQQSRGSLPVRVNVPRLGLTHRFEKLLVIDEVLKVEGKYKKK